VAIPPLRERYTGSVFERHADCDAIARRRARHAAELSAARRADPLDWPHV